MTARGKIRIMATVKQIEIPDDLHKLLKHEAADSDRTLRALTKEALADFLKKRGRQPEEKILQSA